MIVLVLGCYGVVGVCLGGLRFWGVVCLWVLDFECV